MKKTWIYCIPIAFLLAACKSGEDSIDPLVETSSYNVDYDAENLVMPVSSTEAWTVASDATWCAPYTASGTGSKSLVCAITGNITTSSRTANLTFSSTQETQTVTVNQAAGTGGEYHYKLPVIFHVLYLNSSDSIQYVKKGWLNTIIAAVNKLYDANGINMEFELAKYDPNGNELAETGVDRELMTQSSYDCDKFMEGKLSVNSKIVSMLWDLNKYVNIFLYKFKSDESDYVTLGITDLPYTNTAYPLDGLTSGEYYLTHSWDYPQCSSINSDYIYEYEADSEYYDPLDVTITIAHELGHYVGLDHVFTETGETSCSGNDYCDDTPNYNRDDYEEWLENYIKTKYVKGKTTLTDLAARTCCTDSTTFTARNIMDYEYCFSDKFTTNQNERIRYILKYGLFMPGPKYSTTGTSSSTSSRSSESTKPTIQIEAKRIKASTLKLMLDNPVRKK